MVTHSNHLDNETAGAPVDVDEQCGVMTEKNVACSRSLTCKTHGVGAKRSVPGRTKPFDTLLTEFQKRKENRIKQREKEAERQEKKMLLAAGGSSSSTSNNTNATLAANASAGGGSNANNQNNASKASFGDDGDDIAVPQAGSSSSSSHQIRLLSPSPLSSLPIPSPSTATDDIQVQQPSRQDLLQPSSQSQPKSTSNTPHQLQPPTANASMPTSQQHQPSTASTAKSKPSQISLPPSGANNGGSPSKGNTAAEGGPNGQNGAPVSTKKKKNTGEGGKTGKNKTSARNKADLILGEVDDPPESILSNGNNTTTGSTGNTLVGADGNLIVEEEAPDSDDEVDQLLMAMNQSRARPLAMPTFLSYERTPMKLARYRESFLTAFTGRSMSSSAS